MTSGRICQIAMCSADIPASARLWTEVFGFAHAGGRPFWGERLAQIQRLPTGADSTCMIWWVRWGVAVPDFDAVVTRLLARGVRPLTEPIEVDGLRRVCFRELGAAVTVEIFEDGAGLPGGRPERNLQLPPSVVYAAISVSDLALVRELFVTVFEAEEIASDTLHRTTDEALWGLAGARRTCAVFRLGEILVEVCQYVDPVPRCPAPGSLVSDQGLMNVAIGFRDMQQLRDTVTRAAGLGVTATAALPTTAGGIYLWLTDGISIEVLVSPRHLDAEFGFAPMAAEVDSWTRRHTTT
jgi:hypothetical protein